MLKLSCKSGLISFILCGFVVDLCSEYIDNDYKVVNNNVQETADQLFEILIQFVQKFSWKSLLIVTDIKDPFYVIKRLSNIYINVVIVKPSNGTFSHQLTNLLTQNQNHIIVWCLVLPCLKNVVQDNLLYKMNHWLLIYQNNSEFIEDSLFLKLFIRDDSNVYAVIPDNVQNWLIIQLLSRDHRSPSRNIADVGSDNHVQWLSYREIYNVIYGFNLTASTFHIPPMMVVQEINGIINVTGDYHDLLMLFSIYLGFNIEYVALVVSGEKRAETNTFDVQVQKLRNNEISMSGVLMTMTPETVDDLSYSSYLYTGHSVVIFRNIKYKSKKLQLSLVHLHPFPFDVWVVILVLTICCVLLSFFATGHRLLPSYRWPMILTWYFWINEFVHDLLASYPSQGLNYVYSPSLSKNVIVVVYVLFTYFINCCYNSVLIASLAAADYKIPFETLEDMIEDGRFKFCDFKGSISDQFIESSESGVFNDIKTKSTYERMLFNESLDERFTEDFAMFVPVNVPMVENCSNALLKTKYFRADDTYYFPRNSSYVEMFSKFSLRLRSAGILQKLSPMTIELRRRKCEKPSDYEPVNLDNSLFPFFVLISCVLSAIFVFVIEIGLGCVF